MSIAALSRYCGNEVCSPPGKGSVAQRNAAIPVAKEREVPAAFYVRAAIRSAIRQTVIRRTIEHIDGCCPSAAFSYVDDRSAAHLSVDDVLSLLPGGSPCRTEVRERMRLVQPEDPACGGNCCRRRTTYPYCNFVTFRVTGMSVKATECAGKDKGMKFVPLVEKNRVCRHVGHSTGYGSLYAGTGYIGPRRRGDCYQNCIDR